MGTAPAPPHSNAPPSATCMTIQLLCPTCDEKLNCPTEFAGKLGKCPHCGAKFKVPMPKGGGPPPDEDAEEIHDSDILEDDERIVDSDILERDDDGVAGQLLDSDVLDRRTPEEDEIRIGPPPDEDVELDLIVADDPPQREPPPAPPQSHTATYQVQGHPMAALFHYLWEQRKHGAQIELHLKDGEKIAPESYAPGLSQVSHGVFAVKSLDGNHTMAAVAWDSVVRVMVRGVKQLPADTFV